MINHRWIALLFFLTVTPSYVGAQDTDKNASRVISLTDGARIAVRDDKKVVNLQLVASDSQIRMQVAMDLRVDTPPRKVAWTLSCVAPGSNMIGEKSVELASDLTAVTETGRFLIRAEFEKDAFFDCYAFGDGPELLIESEEDQTGRGGSDWLGQILWLLAGDDSKGAKFIGFAEDDFHHRFRWRKLYVQIDDNSDTSWEDVTAMGLDHFQLDIRRATSSGDEDHLVFELTDDAELFTYFDRVGPEFLNFEYRISWVHKDGRVIQQYPDWRESDSMLLVAIPPLQQRDVTFMWNNTELSDVVIEIFCDRFGEDESSRIEVPLFSQGEIDTSYFCDRGALASYGITATMNDGSRQRSSTKELKDDFVWLEEKLDELQSH